MGRRTDIIKNAQSILSELKKECLLEIEASVQFGQKEKFDRGYLKLEESLRKVDVLGKAIEFAEKNFNEKF